VLSAGEMRRILEMLRVAVNGVTYTVSVWHTTNINEKGLNQQQAVKNSTVMMLIMKTRKHVLIFHWHSAAMT